MLREAVRVCVCVFSFLCSGKTVVPVNRKYNAEVHLSSGDVRVDNTVDSQ